MSDLPRGTVTFLFTDIVGSTGLWEAHGHAMPAAYARHDALLRGAIEEHGGIVYKTIGDAFQAAFPSASAAVAATLAAQRVLAAEPWALPDPLRIRTVLHACAVEPESGDYRSPHLNRLGRLLAVGHGGQILLSAAVAEWVRGALPAGASLRDLGERRLKDLAQADRLYQLLHPDLADDFPPLRTLDYRPHNLPVQLTPFVGREREIAAVRERLASGAIRLLTLTGPGGIGKTRLAVQVAAELLERFADGVFFVPLEAITDPALVPSAVAEALGVREAGDRPLWEALREHLGERELLVVLDNFEQVVAAAPLVADLLTTCRRVTLLATSRQTLRLHGEHEFAVPPLGLPARAERRRRLPAVEDLGRFEAVRLFVDRAQAARADFRLTSENASAVAAICAELDGLPLAIELAAARVKVLPPPALLGRLGQRLTLLTGGGRDRPSRQQTLRGAIAWSHDLLSEEERALFRRLAIFAGGCSLEAAEAVGAAAGGVALDPFDGLSSLADKSLMRLEETADGGARFAMLATIREFGLERLDAAGEAEVIRAAHAGHFLGVAERAEPELTGSDQVAWLGRLETEHDNLRAALGWAIVGENVGVGLALAGALWRFWRVRGHLSEGRGWLERALARSTGAPAAVRAKLLDGAGALAAAQGDYARAREGHETALELWRAVGDRAAAARSLAYLGIVADSQGDYALAVTLHEQALTLFREVGDEQGAALSLQDLGIVAFFQGDYERAANLYAESVALLRRLGDTRGVVSGLTNLGGVAFLQEDYARAAGLYEEAAALWRELGDKQGLALALANLGEARDERGDPTAAALYDEALALFAEVGDRKEMARTSCTIGRRALARGDAVRAAGILVDSVAIAHEVGDKAVVAECLEGLAGVASLRGDADRAAGLFGAAEALREAIGAPLPAPYLPDYDRHVAAARAVLDRPSFTAAWTEGRALPLERAVAEAMAAGGPSTPAHDRGSGQG